MILSINLTWKKVKAKGIKGYVIQCSPNKEFIGKVKVVKITNTSRTTRRIKGLKGKKWYVRIRTYKKADGGYVFFQWSRVKKIKLKKK